MSWNFDEVVGREGTDCVKYDLRKEVFGRSGIIPMWVADMDFRTPRFIIDALQKRLSHEILGYSFRPPEYYTSLADWLKTRHKLHVESSWINFSPGIVPALNLSTLAFTDPGDRIIVQPPVYFPFFSAVEAHGRTLVYNQLVEKDGKWEMDLPSLEKEIVKGARMLILSNPHNPVGRAWRKEELEEVAFLCSRHGTLILSDEIHSDLVLPGFSHVPMLSVSPEAAAITVTLVAPSKTFNLAGLSTSSVIIPDESLQKKWKRQIGGLHLENGNIFGNAASVAAYTYGHEWLDALLGYLDENIDLVIESCREIPVVKPVRPEATYMIWLDCRAMGMNGIDLSKFFVEKAGVGLNEGSVFGPGGEGFMRMNAGAPRSTVRMAMEQIKKAVSELRM